MRKPILLLIAGAIAIAWAPILVRVSELGPVATAFYRTALACVPLWFWSRRARDGPTAPGRFAMCLSGLFFALDLAAWHWSIRLTTVANATLLANLAPVFVTLGGVLLFQFRITRRFLAALAIACVGLAVLSGASFDRGTRYVTGDLLGIATAVCYGAYLLSVSRLRQRYSTATIMLWSSASAALVLLVWTVASGETLVIPGLRSLLVLIALAWIAHAGGQSLIAHALAHMPAAYSSLVLITQPVFAALFAWALFHESLSPLQLLGAAVVLSGIWLASRDEKRQRKMPSTSAKN